MASDNRDTALGPAIVGFQTDGTQIQRGAEVAGTELGVQGTGPTGVFGLGQGGPGGRFASGGVPPGPPQIHIDPHESPRDPGPPEAAHPTEFARPGVVLPQPGRMGDQWFSFFPNHSSDPDLAVVAALWVCVRPSEGIPGDTGFIAALWCQVLLGKPVQGSYPIETPFDQ